MDLTPFLLNTLSTDHNLRLEAEEKIKWAQNANYVSIDLK